MPQINKMLDQGSVERFYANTGLEEHKEEGIQLHIKLLSPLLRIYDYAFKRSHCQLNLTAVYT